MQTEEGFTEGGFARTALTDQAHDLSFANVKADMVDCVYPLLATEVKVFYQLVDFYEIVQRSAPAAKYRVSGLLGFSLSWSQQRDQWLLLTVVVLGGSVPQIFMAWGQRAQ